MTAMLAAFAFSGCVSANHVTEGAQIDSVALNPSRIIAVPLLLLPNPSAKVEVDKALVESDKIQKILEKEVLSSFRNQPNVNGVSYQAVRQTLGAQPELVTKLGEQMRETSSVLFSTIPSDRIRLSRDCVSRKSFLDFYAYCLATQSKWTELLNQLSRKILNADSALITVVTQYSKEQQGKINSLNLGVAVLVVDTNSGKLIWGREQTKNYQSEPNKPLAALDEQKEPFFGDIFWLNFPGRKIPLLDPASKL